jgi:hypothetical protein
LALGDVGFLPLGNRLGFLAAHLVVHTRAVFGYDLDRGLFVLVILDALRDPLGIIRVGIGCGAGKNGRAKQQREGSWLHGPLLFSGER